MKKTYVRSMVKLRAAFSLLCILCILTIDIIAQDEISFTKILIDSTYISSGVTTADIDQDGHEDIIAGDVWYRGPEWSKYEIRPAGTYRGTLVDEVRWGLGARYYGRSIGNYTWDVDRDGWLDVITFNSQGAPCYWYRNPGKNYDNIWDEHLAIEVFHNESPQIVDLFGDGDHVVLAGHRISEGKYSLSWFVPGKDPTALWDAHVIGDPDQYDFSVSYRATEYFAPGGRGHGLGIGDINKDGIQDVITPQGWYEGPLDGRSQVDWAFHRVPFDSMADPEAIHLLFAQMFADDFDDDGDMDIIGGSAHKYGLWWFEQISEASEIRFVPREISMEYSQMHAMIAVDLDKDGQKEYVTGKRYLAHLGRDPGWNDPAALIYIKKAIDGQGRQQLKVVPIDMESGSGTQIWTTDMNQDGKPDLLTSNKKGTNLFLQN